MNSVKIGILIDINEKHKTIKILTEKKYQEKKYKKIILKNKLYLAHFKTLSNISLGDIVVIKKSKPLSKTKHWTLKNAIDENFLLLLKKML